MPDHPERCPAVADAIRQRMRELGINQAELIRRSGVSDTTLRKALKGEPVKAVQKRYDLARALGWTPDSIDRLTAGEEPVEEKGLYLTEAEAGEVERALTTATQLAAALDKLLATTEAMRARIKELEDQQDREASDPGAPPR